MKIKTFFEKIAQQVKRISYERSGITVSYYAQCRNLVVAMATEYGHEHIIDVF